MPMTRLNRIIGLIIGMVIQSSLCHPRGLSRSAASVTSLGIFCNPPQKH